MYPQTVTFTLARTCTLVAYHGELMPQFDDSHVNWTASHHSCAHHNGRRDAATLIELDLLAALQTRDQRTQKHPIEA